MVNTSKLIWALDRSVINDLVLRFQHYRNLEVVGYVCEGMGVTAPVICSSRIASIEIEQGLPSRLLPVQKDEPAKTRAVASALERPAALPQGSRRLTLI